MRAFVMNETPEEAQKAIDELKASGEADDQMDALLNSLEAATTQELPQEGEE